MQYRPFYQIHTINDHIYKHFLWARSASMETVTESRIPPDLFDLLKGRHGPFSGLSIPYKVYDTADDAYADLQQAAQALYFSQHQPAQYQNPF